MGLRHGGMQGTRVAPVISKGPLEKEAAGQETQAPSCEVRSLDKDWINLAIFHLARIEGKAEGNEE